jgi:leucyl-tRNA synthetase
MSKSRGNVINPDEVIGEYGADAFRLYEMFMGPLEQMKPWSMTGVEGVSRFLARVWRLMMEEDQAGEWRLSSLLKEAPLEKSQSRVVHASIKKVGEDIEAIAFNTAISQMMIFVNAFTTAEVRPVSAMRTLLMLLSPFAPHLAEELWARLGEAFPGAEGLAADQRWPAYDPQLLIDDEIEIPLQINGKVRAVLVMARDATVEQIKGAALGHPKALEYTAGKEIKKVVVVPGKLVNVVVG